VASSATEADQIHSVVSGDQHHCALRGEGEVWCWGSNEHGQLGNNMVAAGVFPASRVDLPRAVGLSASTHTTCATLETGEVRCWGLNLTGQLGLDVSIVAAGVPTPIAGLSDALSVSVGTTHVCALRRTGGVACWGAGGGGQLGDGRGANSLTPVAVSSLDDAVQVEAGNRFSCARRVDGTVACWGTGDNGQLGAGSNRPFSPTPLPVRDVRHATALHVAGTTACVLDDLAEVYCWGSNASGQAGADAATTPQLFIATRVPGVLATQLGGTPSTTCSVGLDDAVRCWGDSYDGSAGVIVTECIFTCTPGGGCSGTCPAPPTVVRGL
jgi:alpha-tubulin suppressor-like RCC1 family protein